MSKLVYFLVPLGILLSGVTLVNLQEADSLHDLKYMGDHLSVVNTDLPPGLTFCGEYVPLEKMQVKKRIERELKKHLIHTANTRLILRRANQYRPLIMPILRKHQIPEDLFYLAVAESMLSNATSSKGASGFWQFMPTTAREYGLEISPTIDERYHLEKATEAACQYLKASYKRYGSWTLVAASYNMGPTGLDNAIKAQGTKDFYSLKLNRETGNYLYRILGLKCVLDNPARYGIRINDLKTRPGQVVAKVEATESIHDLEAFAKAHHTTVEELRALNPWITAARLEVPPHKSYKIAVPAVDAASAGPLLTAISK
ncbi:MAG: lytic transglycosylase domain-containing protein [Bacteroidetes bacterium]|nr:MAG: lytic transglycosylase domain-containing protein [Bacteroidota bacterium]